MDITSEVKKALLLTAEQYIRIAGGWEFAVAALIANKLYDAARPDSRANRGEYLTLANQAINTARAGSQIQQGQFIRKSNLPTMPGIDAGEVDVAYRVIVVARDSSGNEIFSTAVWIRSSAAITDNQIKLLAQGMVTPLTRYEGIDLSTNQIASYETFIQLAGVRR